MAIANFGLPFYWVVKDAVRGLSVQHGVFGERIWHPATTVKSGFASPKVLDSVWLVCQKCLRRGPVLGATMNFDIVSLHHVVCNTPIQRPAFDNPKKRDTDLGAPAHGQTVLVDILVCGIVVWNIT